MKVGNVSRLGCIQVFSVFSTIQGKTMAKPVKANAPELYNCTHVPGLHMLLSPDLSGLTSSSLKQWKLDIHVKS